MIDKQVDDMNTLDVSADGMIICGGDVELANAFNLASTTLADTINDSSKRKLLTSFTNMLPILKKLNKVCIRQLERRFEAEDNNIITPMSESTFEQDYKIRDELHMESTSSKSKGYIYWLKSHTHNAILPALHTLQPTLLIPRDVLTQVNIPAAKGTIQKGNQLQNLKSHYLSAAKKIVAVADRVMNDKRIEVSKSFVPDEYSFDRMVLSLNEFKEYKNLHELREEGLIDRVSDLFVNLNKWEPIHLPNVGDDSIDSIVNGAIEKRIVATTTANSLFVRKHHNA